MSKLTEAVIKYVEETHFNLLHYTEITNGVVETIHFGKSNPCQDSYSVAKAFVVTAIGMLVDEGMLSTDEKVTEILKKYIPEGMDERWNDSTVHMALKHELGLPCCYLDIDLASTYEYGRDFLKAMLTNPLAYTPGERHEYSDGAYYLLARIVEEKTGRNLTEFMWEKLFFPLEFQEVAWSACPMGHPLGASGLYISSCDMVKLAQLYLQGGEYGGKRIISEDWVKTVFDRGYEIKSMFGGRAYGKGGMCGQMMMLIPEKNRAVAWHAYDERDRERLELLSVEA